MFKSDEKLHFITIMESLYAVGLWMKITTTAWEMYAQNARSDYINGSVSFFQVL